MKIKLFLYSFMFLITSSMLTNLIINNLINIEYEKLNQLNSEIIQLQDKSILIEVDYLEQYSVNNLTTLANSIGFVKLPIKKIVNTEIKPYKYIQDEQDINLLGFDW